ncbi:MAG: hypothetical protein OEY94_10680 [Alphaproteobacteria bacterium]|nr:hypothetical protein [Alphaproteobacteria bacterium]
MVNPIEELEKFENTTNVFNAQTIQYTKDQISDLFKKAETEVPKDQKGNDRLEEAVKRAYKLAAEKLLSEFEETEVAYASITIQDKTDEICKYYIKSGKNIPTERINDAFKRAHGISAEKKLTDLETSKSPYHANVVAARAKEINEHYKKSGKNIPTERIKAAVETALQKSSNHPYTTVEI